MNTPKWAQDLILDAILYIQSVTPLKPELPDIKWRQSHTSWNFETDRPALRKTSSGVCYENHITIVQGKDRIDNKLVILHELAHWALPLKSEGIEGHPPNIYGHEGHTPRFWDLAWQLYREFKLPILYCKKRELEYRKGSLAAYHRSRKH